MPTALVETPQLVEQVRIKGIEDSTSLSYASLRTDEIVIPHGASIAGQPANSGPVHNVLDQDYAHCSMGTRPKRPGVPPIFA